MRYSTWIITGLMGFLTALMMMLLSILFYGASLYNSTEYFIGFIGTWILLNQFIGLEDD